MPSATKTAVVTGLAMLACADAFTTPALSGLVSGRTAKANAISSLNMSQEPVSRRGVLGVAAAGLAAAIAPKQVTAQRIQGHSTHFKQ